MDEHAECAPLPQPAPVADAAQPPRHRGVRVFPVVARLMRGRPIKVEQAEAIARAVGMEFRLVAGASARPGAA